MLPEPPAKSPQQAGIAVVDSLDSDQQQMMDIEDVQLCINSEDDPANGDSISSCTTQETNETDHNTNSPNINVDSDEELEETINEEVAAAAGRDNGQVQIQIQVKDRNETVTQVEDEEQDSFLMEHDDLDEGNARARGIIKCTLQYQQLQTFLNQRENFYSSTVIIRDLPWKLMIAPSHGNAAFGLFVQCHGEDGVMESQDQQQNGNNNNNFSNNGPHFSNWSCTACATFRVLSYKQGVKPFTKKITHNFHQKENDWGYKEFIESSVLEDSSKGYIFPKTGEIHLEVEVIADPPKNNGWDSRKHASAVGLKNQGATCYMNSLLQTLYFTNQLRKAVYKMPTYGDDSSKSVALALQSVFYELQTSHEAVGTKKLTRSFGWDNTESFQQHDVQEFLRVLLDTIENKMKGTCVEGTVPNLFQGEMISYIKCKNVDYESSRSETYYDVQLNIKDKKDIYEAFDGYVETEMLDGDNKYDAGPHGLQEAEKGVIFKSFPPVLHLHLMRFQYDPASDSTVKSNDRFEFYDKIQLDKYLIKTEDIDDGSQINNDPASYTLHAVLVHIGNEQNGHYVVHINPKGDGRWCKFDDDVVFRCSRTEAIEYNFGFNKDETHDIDSFHLKPTTNAYMLVYIRDSELPTVLEEINDETDVPPELLEQMHLEEARRRERTEAHLYIDIKVMTKDAFVGYQRKNLYDPEKMTSAAVANTRTFRILKRMKPPELLDLLSESYGLDKKRLRLWPFNYRENTGLSSSCIHVTYLDVSSNPSPPHEDEDIYIDDNDRSPPPLTIDRIMNGQQLPIFMEVLPPLPSSTENQQIHHPLENDDPHSPNVDVSFDPDKDVIIFLKMYDAENQIIHFVGHLVIGKANLTRDRIVDECRKRVEWSPDIPITLYKERYEDDLKQLKKPMAPKQRGCFQLKHHSTDEDETMNNPHFNHVEELIESELEIGDIIVFSKSIDYVLGNEKTNSSKKKKKATTTTTTTSSTNNASSESSPRPLKLKTVEEFYTFQYYMCDITFSEKDAKDNSSPFTIEMSLKCSYMDMAREIGKRLNVSPLYIQFYKNSIGYNKNNVAIKFYNEEEEDSELLQILFPSSINTTRWNNPNLSNNNMSKMSTAKLFYQILSIPVHELPNKKQFKLKFYSSPHIISDNNDNNNKDAEDFVNLEREIVFYVEKKPRILVKDVLDELAKQVFHQDNEEENKEQTQQQVVVVAKDKEEEKGNGMEEKKDLKSKVNGILPLSNGIGHNNNHNGNNNDGDDSPRSPCRSRSNSTSSSNTCRRQLRLVQISGGHRFKIIPEDTSADNYSYSYNPSSYFRAEEALPEETNMDSDSEFLLPVAHFHKNVRETFGSPFLVKVNKRESWKSLRERIIQRLVVMVDKDKEGDHLANIRFHLVTDSTGPRVMDDDDFRISTVMLHSNPKPNHVENGAWIGIEHLHTTFMNGNMNKTNPPKRTRYEKNVEKSIKIYN